MITYIVRRLFQSVVVIFLVSILIFTAMRVLPGDPILILKATTADMSVEQLEGLRQEFGLNDPLIIQYGRWMAGLVQGDLGNSLLSRRSVADEILKRIPISLFLGLPAFLLGYLLGIPLGVVSAIKRGKWIDTLATSIANIGITVPVFWFGVILIYFFGLYLGVLPVAGYKSPFDDLGLSIKYAIMPIICLSVFPIASVARQTRSSMLEVMKQDYIRTARAKGLSKSTVIVRHALRNALIPVVTLQGVMLKNLLGGSVLVETVFNVPGMGRLAVNSVTSLDYPVIQGVIMFFALVVLLSNLLVDISYGWLDPKIKLIK